MDPGPMSPLEMEALRAATETNTPATEPVAAPAETIEAKSETPAVAAEPAPILPFTLDELFNDPRASKEACRLNDDLQSSMAANEVLRNEARRSKIDSTDAKQKLQQYVRALREAALELNAAGVRTTVDHLVNQPAELPSLVRRLARSVRELQPSIDGLRAEVKRLNGEALEHPKGIAARDEDIKKLRNDVDAGKQREKALEKTTETMQVARDSALHQLKTQQAFGLEAARANDELRAKVEELEGTIKRLQAPAKAAGANPAGKAQ